MPTPSSEAVDQIARHTHPTCPPDNEREESRATSSHVSTTTSSDAISNTTIPLNPIVTADMPLSTQQSAPESATISDSITEKLEMERDTTTSEMGAVASALPSSPTISSPLPATNGSNTERSKAPSKTPRPAILKRTEFEPVRLLPSSPSSFLRSGSQFRGTQQSERQQYEVQVDIKHVDMAESYLCGYLRIQGLTEDHPTLTTYFEGEIIGDKYNFLTRHEDWGSTDKVDLQHWAKFEAFRPFVKQAVNMKARHRSLDMSQQENIFMRWKEHFLVPDHRVRTINGASFEGFYYICFNQIQGTVSGIYFHARSEKFQQLELKHVPDQGCHASMEFR